MNRLLTAAASLVLATPTWAGPWVASWSASPQPLWRDDFVLPTQAPARLVDQTLRQPMRVSLGGARWRVVIANTHGDRPLRIGAAGLARAGGADAIEASTSRPVTFGGMASAEVAPGGELVSDPVPLTVAPLSRVAVSLHLPGPSVPDTFHWDARDTGWMAPGSVVHAPGLPGATPLPVRVFVARLLVEAEGAAAGTVVVLGDSLTDGNGSTPGTDRRWPDALADRLVPHGLAVSNAGISGARLLTDGMGRSAAARFASDVLGAPGARTLVVALGTNDIGWPGSPFAPDEPPMTRDRLVAGYLQLIQRARAHGLRVVGTTLPPFEGALAGTPLEGHHSPAKERLRQAVNAWIRTAGAFDAVVDFDAVLRDPARPTRLAPPFDSGDHLHPGDAGYRAMADAVAPHVLTK